MHNDLEWSDLRLVLAIARRGTLSGAARELGVTHSTVFRRLEAIERKTGARLFDRFREGYAPTAAGDAMAAVAARVADEVLALERQLSGQDLRPSGVVRLTTTDTLALGIAMPHLAAFREAYPEIHLEVAVTNALADLTHRDADIALRPTPDPPPALIGRRLATIAYAVYGSPAYLAEHRGKEWSAHEWIGRDDALSSTVAAQWMRENVPEERIGCRLDAVSAMREAARAGLGLVVLPCYFGDRVPGLRRAQVKPLADARSALWLLTHRDLRHTARIRALMDFLAARLAAERPRIEGRRPAGDR
jgi:DNA-binding transcriptional LysR family regulator